MTNIAPSDGPTTLLRSCLSSGAIRGTDDLRAVSALRFVNFIDMYPAGRSRAASRSLLRRLDLAETLLRLRAARYFDHVPSQRTLQFGLSQRFSIAPGTSWGGDSNV